MWEMQEKCRSGACYRSLEQWFRKERGVQMNFMGVKEVLVKAEIGAQNH
jgi:hypothetical protein